jgi:hypothetical protein
MYLNNGKNLSFTSHYFEQIWISYEWTLPHPFTEIGIPMKLVRPIKL